MARTTRRSARGGKHESTPLAVLVGQSLTDSQSQRVLCRRDDEKSQRIKGTRTAYPPLPR